MLSSQEQFFNQIEKAKKIVVVFDKQWFGDSVASGLALLQLLTKAGKQVELLANGSNERNLYSFLPGFSRIKNKLDTSRFFIISLDTTNTKIDKVKYKLEDNRLDFIITPKDGFFTDSDVSADKSGFNYDLIITVNSPDLESLGSIYEDNADFFYQTPIINLDKHSGNENFGQINIVDIKAVATSEIIYELYKERNELIDESIATCLLSGIISETKSFKTDNITPQALAIVSDLIEMGADRDRIINQLYRSRSLGLLQLWGKVLSNLKSGMDDKLIWSSLSAETLKDGSIEEDALINVIDELIVSIPRAYVIVIYWQTDPGAPSEALVYSPKNINALSLIKEYQPSGTKRLARASLNTSVTDMRSRVNQTITQKLEQLNL